MEAHEQQLTTAAGWCSEAAGLIGVVKTTILGTIKAAVDVIDDTINQANGENTDDAVGRIQDHANETNKATVQWGADKASGKEGVSDEPPSQTKADFENVRDKADENETKASEDRPAFFAANPVEGEKPDRTAVPPVTQTVYPIANTKPREDEKPAATANPPANQDVDQLAGAVNPVEGEKPRSTEFVPPQVMQPRVSPGGGKAPAPATTQTPASTAASAPTPSGGLSGGGSGGGVSGAPSAPSPLSSSGLSGPSGLEQAANASQAASQGAAGQAPVNPLEAFSKGFADSAGTPVHAASTGAPPPLAPSPAVPASDAMAPASSSAPLSQAGAPASAAPVQAPSSGGSMGGMGMGGGMPMGAPPLGPPPTAPPAAPVPPAAAPPPAVTPAANVAAGAQVAPIPVSAARAERDAAQNAAKRTGAGPLELARRIAAALNAPDMANMEDFNFFWITAVTVDGRIVVANNYGLGYIPEQVNLPDQVVMVSADESISPAERASWATYPIVAVQHWAQQNDTTLRAVIALEHQFTNADSGVHQEVLAPEDIPAKGKMAGRDRLQVISPQISGRLAQIGDGDLVKILPPAPVDTNPPEDRRPELWDKVWQPLFSGASNRGQVHLQAFLEYAAHAQEWAVYGAHAAGDGPQQRRAVADFIYWQHIGQLIADAIAE
ncbi:hypothetical protein [Mycolicibacterium septicum]|uniref:hypothetical protein n=1 Tax=Mycolicibacterium septicum TaxID=98668 RepID=UPI00235EE3E5|nr:hypothetical protein [Mycolicibacterium septicum]